MGVDAGFGSDESCGGFVGEVQAELAVELGFVVRCGFGEYCGDVAERLDEFADVVLAHPLPAGARMGAG
ncbi:MAG TPA: hypothetical protein VJ757_06200 [Pseudonocardiaceae bacterium]|nr:hypothetical protein [Pseudonocardiaceae bacterium]